MIIGGAGLVMDEYSVIGDTIPFGNIIWEEAPTNILRLSLKWPIVEPTFYK